MLRISPLRKALNATMTKRISIAFGITHLLSVLALAYIIATSTDPVAVNGWLFFIPIDFPSSLGLFPVSYVIDLLNIISSVDKSGSYQIYRDIVNFWLPLFYFGVVGSIQWYYIPIIASKLIAWCRNG